MAIRGRELGKLLMASAVFAAVVLGWLALRHVSEAREAARVAASPLPGKPVVEQGCTLWFVGSSSMHNWHTLGEDMAPWEARNRGIPGATMDEIVTRFGNERPGEAKPRAIVFYAGENDIAFGGTADNALAGLVDFLQQKRKRLDQLPLLVLSLKPSPTRWGDRAEQAKYNERARTLAEHEPDVAFIDIVPGLLVDGRPGPFYAEDGIHMNAAGYVRWADAVRAELPRALDPAVVRRCESSMRGS